MTRSLRFYPLIPSTLTRITRWIPIWAETGSESCSDEWGKGLVCMQERIKTSFCRLTRMKALSLVTLIPLRKLFVPVFSGCLKKSPHILWFFLLDIESLFCIFNWFQSEFLSDRIRREGQYLLSWQQNMIMRDRLHWKNWHGLEVRLDNQSDHRSGLRSRLTLKERRSLLWGK